VPHLTKGSIVGFDELNVRAYPGETLALKEVLGLDRYKIRRSNFHRYNRILSLIRNEKIKAVIFDLDGTLYDQGAYIDQGFQKVASKVQKDFHLKDSQRSAFLKKMRDLYRSNDRVRIFNRALRWLKPSMGSARSMPMWRTTFSIIISSAPEDQFMAASCGFVVLAAPAETAIRIGHPRPGGGPNE